MRELILIGQALVLLNNFILLEEIIDKCINVFVLVIKIEIIY